MREEWTRLKTKMSEAYGIKFLPAEAFAFGQIEFSSYCVSRLKNCVLVEIGRELPTAAENVLFTACPRFIKLFS